MYNKNQLEFILYVFLNYKEVFNTVFDYIKSAFSDFKLHIKSSVVKYLLITYLLVLLIPIVSGSMIYVKSVNVAKRQAERIVEQINEVLFNNKTVAQGMRDLLDREKKQEYSAINW